MTYAYTLGPRRRLVLGPPQAPTRLCVPIPREVYDALVEMSEREQEGLIEGWVEWLTHVVRVWQQQEPAPDEGSAPAGEGEAEPGEPLAEPTQIIQEIIPGEA